MMSGDEPTTQAAAVDLQKCYVTRTNRAASRLQAVLQAGLLFYWPDMRAGTGPPIQVKGGQLCSFIH